MAEVTAVLGCFCCGSPLYKAMRSGLIGFFLGAASLFLAALVFQQIVIRDAAQDFKYRFISYVFFDTKFPWSYLDQGRVISRFLFPVKVTTTFYDAQYREVTEADKPGRYGAVVRIALNGGVVEHRFITLYRMPARVFLADSAMTVTAQLPTGIGVDPAVLRNQGSEIGQVVKSGFFGDGDTNPELAILLAGLSETLPGEPPAVDRNDVFARDDNWWFGLRQRLGLIQPYPYLLDLPPDYEADPGKRWPLILYLHGGAQKGRDLRLVRESGLAGVISRGRRVPAIVVSPQLPMFEEWSQQLLFELLDEISAKYRVDPDRVYLTGISAGGDLVWLLADIQPGRFAALVPVAGEGDPREAGRIKDIPTWEFQGEQDDVVPPAQVINMIKTLRQAGGHAHLTLFPGAGHGDSWDQAYATDALYPWLFAQKRGQPEVITPGVPMP
jgi:acetyl esterase/lipase